MGRKKIQNTSPVPSILPVISNSFSFQGALEMAIQGDLISRSAWNSRDTYGLFIDNKLILHIGGKFVLWTVTVGDVLANDWFTL